MKPNFAALPMPSDNTTTIEAQATYSEQHGIFQLFESLLQDLLVTKPDDPVGHMIRTLGETAVPKVMLFGAPSTDAKWQAELLAESHSLVHVDADHLWVAAAAAGTEAGVAAKALMDDGRDVTPELMQRMVMDKLASAECKASGWVLHGFPTVASQAHALLKAGILPTRVVELVIDDAEAKRRLTGRCIDLVANVVYHAGDEVSDPEAKARLITRAEDGEASVIARLAAYRYETPPLSP